MGTRGKLSQERRKEDSRQSRIAFPFEKAVEGILGLSPEDAKDVREKSKEKK